MFVKKNEKKYSKNRHKNPPILGPSEGTKSLCSMIHLLSEKNL